MGEDHPGNHLGGDHLGVSGCLSLIHSSSLQAKKVHQSMVLIYNRVTNSDTITSTSCLFLEKLGF